MRRRCESVDAKVSLLRTCDTPARTSAAPCAPQLPVAIAYRSPRVTVSLLIAAETLTSRPRSTARWTAARASLTSLRKSWRKRPASSGPPRSRRLCA